MENTAQVNKCSVSFITLSHFVKSDQIRTNNIFYLCLCNLTPRDREMQTIQLTYGVLSFFQYCPWHFIRKILRKRWNISKFTENFNISNFIFVGLCFECLNGKAPQTTSINLESIHATVGRHLRFLRFSLNHWSPCLRQTNYSYAFYH